MFVTSYLNVEFIQLTALNYGTLKWKTGFHILKKILLFIYLTNKTKKYIFIFQFFFYYGEVCHNLFLKILRM